MKFRSKKRSAIGLDVGSRIIKAAQLAWGEGRYRIEALTLLPRTERGEVVRHEEVRQLKRTLQRQGFQGAKVVLAVRDQELLRASIELPPGVTGAPVAQMARMELSRMHRLDPDAFEMMSWEMPLKDQGTSVNRMIAVGCTHQVADAHLDEFAGGRMDVVALDVRSAAAARACAALTVPMPAITAILDLGWSSTTLLLAGGNSIIYERVLESPSLRVLADMLCKRFNILDKTACHVIDAVGFSATEQIDDLDQKSIEVVRQMLVQHTGKMVEELKVPFAYADHQLSAEGIQRLLLIGGGATIPGFAQHLESSVEIEVKRAAPGDVMENSPETQTKVDSPSMMVAVGLAMFSGV